MFNNTGTLIFDLDGTLWDATQTVADAWQEALKKYDFIDRSVTQKDVQSLAGMPYDAIFEKLFPNVPDKYKTELQETCAAQELQHLSSAGGRLYDGLEETLAYLQGKYKLAIVSNCQSGYIEAFLQHSKLHAYFTDHACYGTSKLAKADNIREVIRRNNFTNAVYIGDTKGDYEASVGANVPFIFAAYGFGEVTQQVPRIARFSELQQLF
ncbi:HAD family hydrolase [Pontibacter liquoris]|uniref:HAD family hydrolase n=1 Tax=Pontibacter liquoris TaxID=2905677 RepID=UPI001FA6F164|nr:HAD family hydrolase [Pontibacter liquoris]